MSDETWQAELGGMLAGLALLVLRAVWNEIKRRALEKQRDALVTAFEDGMRRGIIPESAKELVREEAKTLGVGGALHAAVLNTRKTTRFATRTEPDATLSQEPVVESGTPEAPGPDAPA